MIRKIKPGPGQESVWDYPRPPRLEASQKKIEVHFAGELIASSSRTFRVLETSHPPVYYLPIDSVKEGVLRPNPQRKSMCEYKGQASYYDIELNNKRASAAAWHYPSPQPSFLPLKGYIAFYPSLMDTCTVDGETIRPQAGDFYGGWITSDITGPFKGEPGTSFW